MAATRTHYTARELAGLPGMPTTERGVQLQADRDSWPWQKRAGRGGGREYPITALPVATREHLVGAIVLAPCCPLPETLPEVVPVAELPAVPHQVQQLADLKTWQQRTMDARLVFIRLIEKGACTVGVNKTIDALVSRSRAGDLPDDLQRLVGVANARAGKNGGRALSRSTLLRWWRDYRAAGGNYAALAPAQVEKTEIPPWAPLFLKLYQVPQKPSLSMCVRDLAALLPVGVPCPSEQQVRLFAKKYSRLDIQKGRKSGSELRGQRLYRERDTSGLQPGDIYVTDGHSFKALVAHPFHGRPFKPEVCAVLDVATRIVCGFSIGLSESTMTVADAIRSAVVITTEFPFGGIPAILYADNGGGNTATVNSDDIAGLYSRLGITFKTGIAGNPQGRGLIERLNATLWIPAAKRLPTFAGKEMDSLAERSVRLTLGKQVREAEKNGMQVSSSLLLAWADFPAFLLEEVNAYNHRPHSALPRITCPTSGQRRHMTPAECWADWLQRGWQPVLPEADEVEGLFRPHEMVPCRRGIVRLFKQVYSDPVLNHYHGMDLMVGYDIYDASRVWVRDADGRLIVVAKRDAHKSDYYAVPVIEQSREKRYQNRKKTATARLEEIELERRGAPIEIVPIPTTPELVERTDAIIVKAESKRALVSSAAERYDQIRAAITAGTASDYERQWYGDYETFTRTMKRSALLRADEFCTGSGSAAAAK